MKKGSSLQQQTGQISTVTLQYLTYPPPLNLPTPCACPPIPKHTHPLDIPTPLDVPNPRWDLAPGIPIPPQNGPGYR